MTKASYGHAPVETEGPTKARSKIKVVAMLFAAWVAGGILPCWLKEATFRSFSVGGGAIGFEPLAVSLTAIALGALSLGVAFAVVRILSRAAPRVPVAVAYCVGVAFFLSDTYGQVRPQPGMLQPVGTGPLWLEYVRLAAAVIGSIAGVGLAVVLKMRHAHRTGAST